MKKVIAIIWQQINVVLGSYVSYVTFFNSRLTISGPKKESVPFSNNNIQT